jgi:hypothetical protein
MSARRDVFFEVIMASYYQPESPDLMPFKDSPRCPKCQSDKKMKPVYRRFRTIITAGRGFFPWTKTARAVRISGEHLHMICAACQFSFNMECAPAYRISEVRVVSDPVPTSVLVDRDRLSGLAGS